MIQHQQHLQRRLPSVSEHNAVHSACERVRKWLHDRCGIHFADNKREMLVHRLTNVVAQFNLPGLQDLAERVGREDNHDLLLAVMHAASTNHTYFFREPQILNHFRDMMLPALGTKSMARIWCAAVATGDEAYTLGIIAAEKWGIRAAQGRLAILGTDISQPVIQRAEAGVYTQAHLDNVQENMLERYFEPITEGHYCVSEMIQMMCTFRRLNLKAYPYPFKRKFDIIFSRNVLYYFDKQTQREVVSAMYDVCAPGGWLVTSVTEAVRDLDTAWTHVEAGVYRKLP